ncbi:type VII secretion protein EccCa [Lentzea sp.]|uniref:type VII secretion protein EccCa n=1 Tax=Lentzea sp. TaxID=56099 RepID=UPI002B584E49|nr:type VII secretion protein EccCa [Lentzea sp.]HUQ54860.1 type VII secretion protein EccCa [Lentzea sp.]
MTTVTVKRPPRAAGPELPVGQIELQEPPVLAEPAERDLTSLLMILPMGLGMMVMVLSFSGAGGGSPMTYVMGGGMGIAMVCMGLGQVGRTAGERKKKMAAERRDYLRYIGQMRTRTRATADEQRAAVLWNNPDPRWLWHIAAGTRVWERRANHEDFGRVRIGLGAQQAALELVPPTTKPIEDLEPLSAISLRRFSEAYRTVSGIPIAVGLRSFTSVEFAGDVDKALRLARAMIAQLVTFHAPDELRIAVLTSEESRSEWDWVKWLPHNAHPTARDGAGPVRMLACDHDELMDLLGKDVTDRSPHDKSASPSNVEPFVVVVAHLAVVPESSRLFDVGLRNVVLLDITGMLPGGAKVIRLTSVEDRIEFPSGEGTGTASRDELSLPESEVLARTLAPKRTSGAVELVERSLESDFELTTLLGIRDVNTFDVNLQWRGRNPQRARMAVPIGVTEEGEVVELDLKESAQGGMGPHGLVIGATGSGKSELLRTLVLGLAATHSSEILNLVLVDFKGGATFLGMDRLPHTSAVITNLADELPLVDRMQDSLNGEMIRRQELLRVSGYPSLFEYEKARAAGEPLAPFPTLLLVVDEFSELLASKPEFMDLFVSVGRLGRSLGVHLLLASQRLDEGKIHRVEGHLSYRIALRTFSSMESRSVIGVASAYELPSEPGNGYLKIDQTNLVRFKGAYVSGSAPVPRTETAVEDKAAQEIVPFNTHARPLRQLVVEDAVEEQEEAEAENAAQAGTISLAEAFIGRLQGAGPAARQVWLPPLAESPSLDSLLPSVLPDPFRGMNVEDRSMQGRLRAPLGMIDRPYEQVRELMVADLSGADGHVAVVGAPQTGKSTLLRTLVLSLAMSHTPSEIQFYGLDFAGGGIMSIAGLPHVGSVATRLEHDRVVRTIAQLLLLIEARETEFTHRGLESMAAYRELRRKGEIDDPYGDVFLIVDGWYTIKQDYADLEPRINELAVRGLSFGIHVIIGATRWSEIRPALRDVIGSKFELRLGDPMESEVGSRKAQTVPSQPGRGITPAGLHFLSALPRMDGSSDTETLASATKELAEEVSTFWPGQPAPPVRMLPPVLPSDQLPKPTGDVRIAIGLDEQRLEPVWHDFEQNAHMLVFGDSETGKTNMLRTVLRSIMAHYGPDQAKILLGDPNRQLDVDVPEDYRVGYAITGDTLKDLVGKAAVSMSRRVPGEDVSSDRLRRRDWWEGPQFFLVVDDYELFGMGLGSPLEALLPTLAQGVYIGMHVIIARSTSGAMRALSDPVIRRMWELGTPGIVFSYPKEEGKFLGEAMPRKLVPGRAQLVNRKGVRLVQTGFASVPATSSAGGGEWRS